MLGFFEAFCGPPAYSLIVDYFPPEVRTTANAVYAFGIYVGNALSSLIIVMITALGWRWAYAITGIFGIVIGFLVLLIVKDPVRGRYEPRVNKPVEEIEKEAASLKLVEEVDDEHTPSVNDSELAAPVPPRQENICVKYLGGFKAMFTNKICLYVVLGACFRYWQGYTIAYFALTFFADYEMPNMYGICNGISIMVGGFSSQLIAAQISDRYESKMIKVKPYVCIVMSLLGVVTSSLCFFFSFNFYFSMAFLFL